VVNGLGAMWRQAQNAFPVLTFRHMFDQTSSMPTSPDPDLASVLHSASLEQLRLLDPAGGNDFLLRVLGTYQQSLKRQLDLVQDAARASDMDQLGRAAHTLKSASASVGAVTLASLCEVIEHRVRRGESGLGEAVDAFVEEAGRVNAAVAKLLDERAG
jgi:histidine phosphotransfer protein HptB